MANGAKRGPKPAPDHLRCTARNRQGKRCGNYAINGRSVCRYHGGAPGTGRPPTHGLYAKRILKSSLDVYDRSDAVGIDEEIRVARANLAWALEKQKADPDGGVPIASLKDRGVRRIRPWFDIVREYVETIRRLLEAKAKITLLSGDDQNARSALDRLMEQVEREAAAWDGDGA